MDMGLNDFRGFDAPGRESAVEAALRPLGWSELCARLVAAQDYRRGLAGGDRAMIGGRPARPSLAGPAASPVGSDAGHGGAAGDAQGSFHTGTARMLEHFDTGNRAVNSNSSTYGKGNGGTPVDSLPPSPSAFAERQADENRHD